MSYKIKKGDTVKVIAGKDKDKEGKVIAVKDGKVLVEGVNMVTKHTKPSAANQQGGIVETGSLYRRFQRNAPVQRSRRPESDSRWTETKKFVLPRQLAT